MFNMILLSQVGIDGFMKIYTGKDQSAASVEGVRKTLEILPDCGPMSITARQGATGTMQPPWSLLRKQECSSWGLGKGRICSSRNDPRQGIWLHDRASIPGMVYIADSFYLPKSTKAETAAAQKLLAEVVMDPKVQVEFSLKKGSIPLRADVDLARLDVCAQKGAALLKSGLSFPTMASYSPLSKSAHSTILSMSSGAATPWMLKRRLRSSSRYYSEDFGQPRLFLTSRR